MDDTILNNMVVMTENDKTINPKVLDLLSFDLTTELSSDLKTSDTWRNTANPTTSSNETQSIHSAVNGTTKKIIKRNYGHWKNVLEIEKEKLQESQNLHNH